ncbi:MAG: restriction endonuclease subunit S [Cyanobacteria bacterium P01_E01_bin.42]
MPEEERYENLLLLTDGDKVGESLDGAMEAIARENEDLSEDNLFVGYANLEKGILLSLLKTFIERTVRLCRMNLAVYGILGLRSVMATNTYYENVHDCMGEFDYVMANPQNIKEIEILLPPLPIQKKIAGVLSAYNDPIENNQRRIALKG